MSKKQKRFIRKMKRKEAARNCRATDCHHLLFQGRHWQRGVFRVLRQHHYCKVRIPRETLHKEIHHQLTDVPVPKSINAIEALKHLEYLENFGAIHETDSIERRLIVLISLFDGVEPNTALALKRQLTIVRDFYNKPS